MKTNLDDEKLIKLAYINVSTYRVKAMNALKDGQVKTPTAIAKDSGIRVNHMSKVLGELKESGVAECINEEARKGRLYRLTSVGEEIVDNLDDD